LPAFYIKFLVILI